MLQYKLEVGGIQPYNIRFYSLRLHAVAFTFRMLKVRLPVFPGFHVSVSINVNWDHKKCLDFGLLKSKVDLKRFRSAIFDRLRLYILMYIF